MKRTFPWGWPQYLWCKFVHRDGEWSMPLTARAVYRCKACSRWHFFDGDA